MRKRIAVLLMVGSVAIGGAPASPATAAGGAKFECTAVAPAWPALRSSTQCSGTAHGVFQAGAETVMCVQQPCDYEMSITYENQCILAEPSFAATFEGTITITGVGRLDADYDAALAGRSLRITTSNPAGTGDALMIQHDPVPTCANPGTLHFELIGSLAFS